MARAALMSAALSRLHQMGRNKGVLLMFNLLSFGAVKLNMGTCDFFTDYVIC